MQRKSLKRSKLKTVELSVDQTLRFLEDVRTLYRGTDEPTQAISLRVPKNVLRSFKTKAGLEGRKYQSVIVALMRKWIVER
jgi:predicted DNA binding CopG/RHH family protein